MYQQLWGYKVEEKLYLGVREQKRLNTTVLKNPTLMKRDTLLTKFTGHFSAKFLLLRYKISLLVIVREL
jgi:hypothetical protein